MGAERGRCCHVMIYGPPGAGKLTTARALGDAYGLRVLDNHLSVDPALRLFNFGTPEFNDLVERIRVMLLQAAGYAQIDIVSTLVYAHGVDDSHVRALVNASTGAGAQVVLVQLSPSIDVLVDRLGAPSRVGTKKITDPATLGRMMKSYDLRTPYRPDDLTIDNSHLPANNVANVIARHVGLMPGTAEVASGAGSRRRPQE